jgi:hypothetical protein
LPFPKKDTSNADDAKKNSAPPGEPGQSNITSKAERAGRSEPPTTGANAEDAVGAATNRLSGRFGRNRIFGSFVGRGEGAIEPLGTEPELKRRFLGFNMTGGFIDPSGDGGAKIFRNRLRLREGPGAIDAEHLAGLAFGIHQSLLISTVNDADSTIELFPAWPKAWAVNFKLLARGGTLVTSAQQDGKVLAVKLAPKMAGTIHLKNPWGRAAVKVTRGDSTETLNGEILTVSTMPGEVIRINP